MFAAEAVLVLRAQAVGIDIDIKGPLKALLDAVGGDVAWLGARIVLAYVAGFVALSLVAGALSWGVRGKRPGLWMVALALWLVWRRAVWTPALFDDVPYADLWLPFIVAHGEPWHPAVAALALVAVFVVVARRRRTELRLVVLAGLALAVCAARAISLPGPGAEHPLVILFGVDALRPDRLAALGGTRGVTPEIDRFVEDATLFTRAYTPIAATDAAWRSMLTARWPADHAVRYSLTRPEAQNAAYETFARAFKRNGYTTVFRTDCSRFHYETEASGFGVRLQPPQGAINFLFEKLRFRALSILDLGLVPEMTTNRALAGMYDARGDAETLARDVVRRSADGPLLYAYHATAAHFPGDPQFPFYRAFVPSSEPLARRLRMHFQPLDRDRIEARSREVDPYPTNAALYDELLAQGDMQFGVLRRALEDAGLYEDATIIVLSDHGEDFYEDRPELLGELSVHGALLNDAQYRVVLAVKPSARAGFPRVRRVDKLARLIDVGQTLLTLAGLPPLANAPGRSLEPLLRGAPLDDVLLLAETAFTHVAPDIFEPEHYAGALRSFEAYDLGKDGSVAVKKEVHAAIMREKDFGIFDGARWLVRWRDRSGQARFRCTDMNAVPVADGDCPPDWRAWLEDYASLP